MGPVVPKEIENIICTMVKYGETFYGRHTTLTPAQFSLNMRTRSVWSGPSLFVDIFCSSHLFGKQAMNSLNGLCNGLGSHGPSLFPYGKRFFRFMNAVFHTRNAKNWYNQAITMNHICLMEQPKNSAVLVHWYSEPSLYRQHLFPKMLPLKWICYCTEWILYEQIGM